MRTSVSKVTAVEGVVLHPAVLGAMVILGLLVVFGLARALAQSTQSGREPKRLAAVDGLSAPEALIFDPARNVYFVSNVNGTPGVKDGNGFITRITADGKVDSLHFIQGGRGGVVLNGPMGSRIRGDTLWVLDIDALRAFDTRTGAPLTWIDLSSVQPVFTNDLDFGPDGDIYITDTGVRIGAGGLQHIGPDRIYRISKDRQITVVLDTAALNQPDGIAWDHHGGRMLLAPIGGAAVQSWELTQRAPVDLPRGAGSFDGIEVEHDGSAYVTSWGDSSISEIKGTRLTRVVGPLGAPPADVSVDTKRGRMGVAYLTANRFELWTLR